MRRGATCLALAGLGVVLYALVSVTWITVTGHSALSTPEAVFVSGADAIPLLGALAPVIVAASAALGLLGPRAARILLTAVAACGTLVAGTTVFLLTNPGSVSPAAGDQVTPALAAAGQIRVSGAPWAACVAGLTIAVLSALAWRTCVAWTRSTRHENAQASTQPHQPRDLWDAISDGRDPT